MADADDGFLSRWSRRKSQTRNESEQATETPEGDQTAVLQQGGPVEAVDPEREAEIVAKLPDIDSLDETSDFTQFLQEGVPEALRRKALRKLWRLNPVFANLDGLNDYDEDFTDAATVVEGLKTMYQVGKGMTEPEPPPEDQPAAGDAPDETVADTRAEDDGGQESAENAQVDVPDTDGDEQTEAVDALTARDDRDLAPAVSAHDDRHLAPAVSAHDNADSTSDAVKRPGASVGSSAATRRWERFRS